MIGTGRIIRNNTWLIDDLHYVKSHERVYCPVCGVPGEVRYFGENKDPYFYAEGHINKSCQKLSKTKSIKYISACSGAELIDNILSTSPRKSRTKIMTLEDIENSGMWNCSDKTKVRDGLVSDYLISNYRTYPILRNQKNIGRRIIRAKYKSADDKDESILLTVTWTGNNKTNRYHRLQLRLYFCNRKEFITAYRFLVDWTINERGFLESQPYKGWALVAGDWKSIDNLKCKWLCDARCEDSWVCHGMFVAHNVKVHHIHSIIEHIKENKNE